MLSRWLNCLNALARAVNIFDIFGTAIAKPTQGSLRQDYQALRRDYAALCQNWRAARVKNATASRTETSPEQQCAER